MKVHRPVERISRFLLAAIFLFLSACNLPTASSSPPADTEATPTPFEPQTPQATQIISLNPDSPSEDSRPARWWLSPDLPQALVDQLQLPADAERVDAREEADLALTIGESQPLGHWVYALAEAFPTILDGVDFQDLLAAWQGDSDQVLLMSAETEAVFSALWGAGGGAEVLQPDELLEAAWATPGAWVLLPFEALEPKYKVLTVDGISPIHEDFYAGDYELAVPITLEGDADLVTDAQGLLAFQSNRDPDKMTTVLLTGVTALVRATAYTMDQKGITYPAEDVGSLMASADITHISNEVPFWDECPPPDPVQRGLVFCSNPDYIALLEAVGTDVVELTGDHFNDHGQDPMLYSLDLYDEYGIPYYGGGHNLEEGRSALIFEHNGNRIAFIGCNGKQGYATASETQAGAVQCDYDWLDSEVSRLSDEGYLVIATFQHNEVYSFVPQPGLIRDFAVPAEAGASIVSGSQAHQAHGMGFTDDDTLVMYGLGNMFFDQWTVVDNGDKALMAMHIFYEGRYISTELYTIQFVDFAKPRFMTDEERADFLNTLFSVSLWN